MTNSDLVGRTLGPYTLEVALGRGGMASVYRAFQASVKRYVAIKVMALEIANQPGFLERFEREAQVIASLEHPHILPVIDYGTQDNIHYLVMRYLEGGSLDQLMRQRPLTMEETSRLLTQVASALDYAHKRGVVHRDIKPNNILLDSDQNAYLTDFGIARLMQSEQKLTATGNVMGTPAYMSPEQGMGRTLDSRSDIYSLGVVLYEMVLNRLPFFADTSAALIFQHVYEKPTHPKLIKPDLPDSVVAVLDRAMAKNPDDRYQLAMDMANAFAEAIRDRRSTPLGNLTGADYASTFVGGPMTPVVDHTSSGGGGRGTPTSPPGGVASGTFGGRPYEVGGGYATAGAPAGTPAASTPAAGRKLPITLIAGIAVVVILVILGGIGAFALTNANNQNQTSTAVAIALSATKTPTPTDTFTPTPNATELFQIQQSTAQAAATATALQAALDTATAVGAQAAATQNAQLNRTATAQQALLNRQATGTSRAMTQTAQPTRTPTPTRPPTSAAPTSAPVNMGSGSVNDVLAALQSSGDLPAVYGNQVSTSKQTSVDVTVKDAGYNTYITLDGTDNMTDFIASADVTWDSPDEDNGCGFMFRYNEPDANTKTFYDMTIRRDGTYIAEVRDKTGYNTADSKTVSSIDPSQTATNHIVLIGLGTKFTLYINNTKAASITESTYPSGSVAVLASRGSDTSGLTCHFSNVWVYSMISQDQVTAGLTSNDITQVIGTLNTMNLVPKGARHAPTDKQHALNLSTTNKFTYFPINALQYTNFAVSSDLTMNLNSASSQSKCGIMYDVNGDDTALHDLAALVIGNNQGYAQYLMQTDQWQDSLTQVGTNDAINSDSGATNRLTAVYNGGKITFFVNGIQVYTATQTTLTSGQVGYILMKWDDTGQDQCTFTNTTVWTWNK